MSKTFKEVTAELQCKVEEKGLPPLLKREFVQVGDGDGESLRIMQWNMLAQGLSGGTDNFILCPAEALVLETRQLRVLEEIVRYRPTILCMEEVDRFEFIFEFLATLGYIGIFFPKPDSPCLYTEDSYGADGCAIFYDTHKVSLSQSDNVILRLKDGALSNQVFIVAQFQTKSESSKQFYVAVTHLKSKKGYSEMRHQQATFMTQYLTKNCSDAPIVICGDFNSEPSEKVYEVMLSCSLDLSSAYTSISADKKSEPKYTTWKTRPNGEDIHTIDYIWYSNKGIKVKSVLDVATDDEIGKNGLPSWRYPSDHLSLICDMLLE